MSRGGVGLGAGAGRRCPGGRAGVVAAVGAALVCYGMPVLIMAVLSRLGKAGIIVYPARYLPPAPATMLRKTPH